MCDMSIWPIKAVMEITLTLFHFFKVSSITTRFLNCFGCTWVPQTAFCILLDCHLAHWWPCSLKPIKHTILGNALKFSKYLLVIQKVQRALGTVWLKYTGQKYGGMTNESRGLRPWYFTRIIVILWRWVLIFSDASVAYSLKIVHWPYQGKG